MAKSPVSVIYGNNGTSYVETTIRSGIAVPSGQPGILGLGSDGANTRYITVDSSGRTVIVGPQSNGSAVTGNPVLIGGSDGTNVRNIRTATDGTVRIDPTGTTTQPISATTLPLPTGAATEATLGGVLTTTAFQARINTLGQKTMANSTPVVIASDQSALTITGTVTANIGTTNGLALESTQVKTTITPGTALGSNTLTMVGGAVTTAAPTYTTGNVNQLSITTAGGLRVDLAGTTVPLPTGAATETTLGGVLTTAAFQARINTLGQKTMANSTPVVLASDQAAIPVSQSGTWNIANISGTVSLPTGAATETTLSAISGKLPAALVGGRFDVNLGSWLGSTAPTVGQKTMGSSVPVVISSDQSTLNVAGTVTANQGGTWNITNISGTVSLPTGAATAANQTTLGSQTTKVNDGTNTITIKAASTAAVATDTALVVAISPNNTVGITQADTVGTGTLNALNAVVQVALAGKSSFGFVLAAGTLVGTIVPEVSLDGGTSWVSTLFDDPTSNAKTSSIVFAVANTLTVRSLVSVSGATHARVRVSAFTSGTASASMRATITSDPSLMFTGQPGNSAPPSIAAMGAQVTTAAPSYTTGTNNALSLTTTGSLRVGIHEGSNQAAVKAASTAPVTSDPALVTVLSPNQPAIPVTSTGSEEATYTVIAQAVAPGNNKSMISIYNPTGSGYSLKLREFYIRNAATTALTGVAGKFELHRFASASAPTGGTALTVLQHDSNDALPASMDARTGGTISGEIATPLDVMWISTDEWGPGTLDQEGAQQTIANYLPARAKRDALLKPFFAHAGQGLHMKFATNSTAGSIDVVFVFTKV